MQLHRRLTSALVALSLCCIRAQTDPEAHTPAGTFRGKILTSHSGREYASYRGIPYALPPTGDRRFALPVRQPVIEGIYDATEFGSVCVQHEKGKAIGQEDCLFVNVFTPLNSKEAEDGALKKVFVYIYGGGLVIGASDPYLPGDLVTRGDIIVVTMNYRLNWFGFLRGNSGYTPGNQGHWDQLLSLQWVRDNIRAFGGDPDDVTISGESAGSMSTSLLSVSPLAKGLFTKAVLLSGTVDLLPTQPRTSNDILQMAAKKFGCGVESVNGNEDTVVKCLKKLPSEVFVPDFEFNPLIGPESHGDDLLPRTFSELLNDTEYLSEVGFYSRDYIVSITADDGYVLISASFGVLDIPFKEHVLQGLTTWLHLSKRISEFVVNEYTKIYGDLEKSLISLTTDITFLKLSVSFVEAYARQSRAKQGSLSKNAYLLAFDHSPRYVPKQFMLHALDLAYLFDLNTKEFIDNSYNIKLEDTFYEEDIQLKGDYIDLVTAFIKTGSAEFAQEPLDVAMARNYPMLESPFPRLSLVHCAAACLSSPFCAMFLHSLSLRQCALFGVSNQTTLVFSNSDISQWTSYVYKSDCKYMYVRALNSCWKISNDLQPMSSAQFTCQNLGGGIIQTRTLKEFNFLRGALLLTSAWSKQTYWIGASKITSSFTWLGTDLVIDSSMWADNQPDGYGSDVENCVNLMATFDFAMNDGDCREPDAVVCRIPLTPA